MTSPLPLPDWVPWWVHLVMLLGILLFVLVYLALPFSVFGTKARLESLEAHLDEIQGELRNVALRLPEMTDVRGYDLPARGLDRGYGDRGRDDRVRDDRVRDDRVRDDRVRDDRVRDERARDDRGRDERDRDAPERSDPAYDDRGYVDPYGRPPPPEPGPGLYPERRPEPRIVRPQGRTEPRLY